jgi:hypothetical protein
MQRGERKTATCKEQWDDARRLSLVLCFRVRLTAHKGTDTANGDDLVFRHGDIREGVHRLGSSACRKILSPEQRLGWHRGGCRLFLKIHVRKVLRPVHTPSLEAVDECQKYIMT